jgi:hypothetical protein
MITLKLTDGEFLYLHAIFTGSDDYHTSDSISLRDKVLETYAPTKTKPKPNHVWEALKGVVG